MLISTLASLAKRAYLPIFNKQHGTKIKSANASLHASYGKGVLIDKDTIVEDDVRIGDHSYVNKRSSVENCSIGKYCSISSGVYICPFEHKLDAVTTHPVADTGDREKRPAVTIGNDVLISLNAIILAGATVGDGAVIAAGAVVTHDVAPYEIVGGVPARHIGWRAQPETVAALEEMRWWDWDEATVAARIGFLSGSIDDVSADASPASGAVTSHG